MTSFVGHLIFLFIIGVVSLIFHELGHITASRWNRAEQIYLIIGAGKQIFTFTIGRLIVRIQQLFFMHFVTVSNRDKTYTSKERIVISIMGPAFSILLAVFFYSLFYFYFSVYVVYIGFLFNIWLAFFNLIPLKIGQKATDGYIIYKTLTNSR